jgi:two-component system LytT family sensor kinase
LAEKILENRSYQFWLVNAVGWAGWCTLFMLRDLYWGSAGWLWFFVSLAMGAAGFFLSALLRYIYHMVWDKSVATRVVTVLVASYAMAAVWQPFKNILRDSVFHEGKLDEHIAEWGYLAIFDSMIAYAFFPFLCWSGLYFGIKYYQLLQQEKQKSILATARAHEAQLRMLRYQLNPHFLFNTLNAISTLVLEKDTANANTMLTRLSRFLRYSLDTDPMETVDLEREINTVKLYLEIEKVRFEERLQVEFNLDGRAGGAMVPSLLLQPLVENSLKYAVAPAEEGGKICINAKVVAEQLQLEIVDDGPGLDEQAERLKNSTGVGIVNTKNRLQELYGDRQSCRFSSVSPHGLKVSIVIPYQRAKG